MAKDQIYSSVIRLNTEDARNKMEDLKKRVQDLVALRDTIDKKKDSGYYKSVSKQINAAKAELKVYENEVMKTIQTLDNLGNASAKDIRDAQKALQKMIDAKPQGAEEMGDFVRRLQEVKQELQGIAAMRAFDEVKAGITGTGKSAQQLGAEMRFLRETSENAGTASVQQLEKALEVAQEHLRVAKQGSQAYERSSEYIRQFNAQLEESKAKQKQSNTLIDRYNRELKEAGKEAHAVKDEHELIKRTLDNISKSSVRDLEYSIKALNEQMRSMDRDSDGYKEAEKKVRKLRTELEHTRKESAAQQTVWGKFTKFLNDSWGGLTMLIGSLTGLSMTIRKAVQDYAKMEEAMADTRKYTGLTDEAIRDLNEDLKKMDTRTSREELNELAGTAGRLGITSKASILEFVDAANQIKVALGDDLGEGAIDNVGKLAMAFGEDERMGLRGAMLATGSAVNELAQNSSAKAGYMVDFTARVAGFGKQLGLTQAQIMGFGAVMDENLLRDEMAATAFGNMLTKMQTDTAKFAKIAGMDVKVFTDLLNKDANAAILALADNMKRVDPQSMMKMLDDMGLDGARAVGVLSTMVDKIDDVRARQELATKAYREATSIGNEYRVMNNTVEAGIDKCKKQFQEMAVELGEKFVPAVKYTISSTSLLIKALSSLMNFAFQNIGIITKLTVLLAEYVAIKKLHYLWTQRTTILITIENTLNKAQIAVQKALIGLRKAYTIAILAHNGAITKTIALQRIWNEVLKKNPIALAVTAVALLAAGIWKLIDAMNASGQKQRLVNELYGKAAEKVAEERSEISQLLRVARDEKEQLDKRKEAIEKLNSIIPGYNGQLDETTGKYTENAIALKNYNTLLKEKYRLEAAEDKLKELEKKRFREDLDYEEKLRESQERVASGGTALTRWAATQGPQAEGSVSEKAYQEQLTRDHEKQNAVLQKQIDIVTGIRDATKEVVDFNNKLNQQMEEQRKKLEGDKEEKNKPTPTSHYISESERKKQEAEAIKAETERKKKLKEQADAAKASYNEQLTEEMLAYRQGISTYSDYLEEKHNITQNYYDRLKAIYGEDSVEYRKQLLNREKDEDDYIKHQNKKSQQGFRMERIMRELELQKQFNDQNNKEMFQNEEALNEALFRSDRQYMLDKQSLYKEGSLEWEEAATEIKIMEEEHRLQLEQEWMRRLSQYRQEMGQTDYDRLQQIEIAGVESFYRALVEQGNMTQAEVDEIIEHIKRKYAELKGEQKANSDVQAKAASGLETAKKNAGVKDYGAGDNAATGVASIANAVQNQQLINEQLKQLYGEDYENNREYQEAKRQLDMETMQQIVAGAQAAYSTIGTLMSAASSYAKACSDLEVARITANYDKQIEAAGRNSKKKEKLEKERDKKIAEAKTKANKKAMAMEIAQAIAQTAMGAISAYSSTMAGAPYPANLILAPISAGIALAAGALQIATIKKQHQAQEAGYYEGGFTGGRRYRKEAGVVHEGEFVANHQAVSNPNILPFLNFLDQAQRNNTVGSLTAQDVSRSMGAGGSSQIITPIVNVQTDNGELRDTMEKVCETQDRLASQLEQGIGIDFPMDSFDQSYKHYKKIRER